MVPEDVVLALRDAVSRSSVGDFGLLGVVMLRRFFSGLILRLVAPTRLAALPFLLEVCCVFVACVWEVELLVAGDLVGYIGLVKVMRSTCMCSVLCQLFSRSCSSLSWAPQVCCGCA